MKKSIYREIADYCRKNRIRCVFVDFFDTIVRRNCSSEEVKQFWAKELSSRLQYFVTESALLQLRLDSEQTVVKRSSSGEFQYSELLRELYNRIELLFPKVSDTYSFEAFSQLAYSTELYCERAVQNEIGETVALIQQLSSNGIKVLIVSDFYLGKEALTFFLEKIDVLNCIEDIFVSCDYQASKFRGDLYPLICQKLCLLPEECIMIGDHQHSDVQMAGKNGIYGFRLTSKVADHRTAICKKLVQISKDNSDGAMKYSNYCFLLYLYLERLYKTLIRRQIPDLYFLSREGQFLKRIFDLFQSSRPQKIRTHYLYVSRKATYPAGLRPLSEESFDRLRVFPTLSVRDFFDNLGMKEYIDLIKLRGIDVDKKLNSFFDSDVYRCLKQDELFQQSYENCRKRNRTIFSQYCRQQDISPDFVAFADVGWNGTIQDQMAEALGLRRCCGFYVGVTDGAKNSKANEKVGLVFSQNPATTKDVLLWKYDHVFLERLLTADHGAADGYEDRNGKIFPVLKTYDCERDNYVIIKPLQDTLVNKIIAIDQTLKDSCYTAEDLYEVFRSMHLKTLYIVNSQQLKLQKKLIDGQIQNFGSISPAGHTIRATFSVKRIAKTMWKRLRVLKNTEIVFRILLCYRMYAPIRLIYLLAYLKNIR